MSAADFPAFIDFIMGPSRDGSKDDSAPGETFVTDQGITQMTWDAAVADGLVTGSLTDMTTDDRDTIYRVRFWNAIRADNLPSGVDVMVANDAVLAGVGHAAKLLQRIVGVTADGVVGPATLGAVRAEDVCPLIDKIAAGDDAFFASLAKAPLFLKGWTRREDEARALALQLAGITPGGNLTGFQA